MTLILTPAAPAASRGFTAPTAVAGVTGAPRRSSTKRSILEGPAIFAVGAMFVLVYGLVAVSRWCSEVWRRALVRPRDLVAATAPSAPKDAPRATVA